jgi:quercetin dioxygenase-like cupin family protein
MKLVMHALLAFALCILANSGMAQVVKVLDHSDPLLPPPAGNNVARIMKIQFQGGGISSWHMHPYPIYVYVVRGRVGLQFRGQEVREFSAGQGWHEPAGQINRVVNLDTTDPVELVMFQISEAKAPFNERAPAQ